MGKHFSIKRGSGKRDFTSMFFRNGNVLNWMGGKFMIELKGKWALITGASRGIGREIALAMAKEGTNLLVHSRKLSHTASLVKEIEVLGGTVIPVEAELSDRNQVRNMAKEIKNQGIVVDVLFNNAGVQPKSESPYWQMDVEDYLWTYQINVLAPMLLIEAFLPQMLEQNFGRIINTTSGIKNQPEQGAYAASKGALDKLTDDFSGKIQGTDICINVADPGWIKTDLGGEAAHHEVRTVIPGMIVGAFVSAKITGKRLSAQDYKELSLAEAVEAIESVCCW